MRVRPVLLALAVTLAVAGCSSGDDDEPRASTTSTTKRTTTTTTTEPTTTSTTAPASTTLPTVPFAGTTEDTRAPSATDATAHLTAVEVTSAGGVDRVELTFDGNGAPGVFARYVDEVRADGSGNRVDVAGSAFLQVSMEPAASVDLRGERPVRTYDGPDRVTGDSNAVTEVVRVGDFEAVLTYAIGLRSKAPFRILQLPNPARVVIEVKA